MNLIDNQGNINANQMMNNLIGIKKRKESLKNGDMKFLEQNMDYFSKKKRAIGAAKQPDLNSVISSILESNKKSTAKF